MLYLACLPWASHLPVSSTFPRGGLDNLVKAFTNLLTLFDSRIILPGSALEEPRILTDTIISHFGAREVFQKFLGSLDVV